MDLLLSRLDQIFPLLGYFLIGLTLNLTPCVYPMMTVTVSLFGKNDVKERTQKAFLKALCYFLGIVFMYSALGLFATMTGTLFGSLLQNRLVLLVLGIFIFILALSMFGLYQLQAPAALLNRLGRKRGAGYLGLFFSGVLVGIFAAPCIGPPIVAVLSIAVSSGDPVFGFWSFFVLSLGLGLPYLILGTFAGLIRRLPKSGQWLVWVERVFGVILLGLSLFYLSLAINAALSQWVLPLTVIVGGAYLGFFVNGGLKNQAFTRFKGIVGIVCVLLGMSLLVKMPKSGLNWETYTLLKIEAAVSEGKPVIIDFYADWCITCHEIEAGVFLHPEVQEVLSHFVRLRVDNTIDSPQVQEVLERYDVFGLPTIVFLDRTGKEVEKTRVIGYIPPEEFLDITRRVMGEAL